MAATIGERLRDDLALIGAERAISATAEGSDELQ